ncbi:MAG: FAD:protein FMN transferase [Lachnospiraceae bacterium]|nr:FAD:protein FMN transferase [Lachnospiraceae bacterium]
MKKLFLISAAILIILLCGCSSQQEIVERDIFALDTFINIKLYGGSEEQANLAQESISELEALFSVTDEKSEISRINSHAGESVAVSDDVYNVIEKAQAVSNRTDGSLDISVYPVVKLWGFTTDERHVPIESDLQSALKNVAYSRISLDETSKTVTLESDMQLDLGAAAKGYIAEKVAEKLKSNGVESAVLSFGGNIQTIGLKGGQEWKIGIKYPNIGDNFGVLSTGEASVVTSATDQRFFEENGIKYHHIIDPKTGYPTDNGTSSVTVVCKDGATADSLSTALFVMGVDRAKELYLNSSDFDFIILTEDGRVFVTEGISDNFTLTDEHSDLSVEVVG